MNINLSTKDIKYHCVQSLIDGVGLSIIRLGDGEMIVANNNKDKIKKFCNNQIGRELTPDELIISQQNLIKAVLNSNILGLPTEAHCRKNILWHNIFKYYEQIKENYKEKWLNKNYCSINCHLDLLNSGDLFDIFSYPKKIVIISSRDIVKNIKNKFTNIENVEWYSIPAEQKYEIIKNKKINIFDEFNKISENLKSESRNHQLLIFGAGPFGKYLGVDFAALGGVALDLGSVFDLFVGKQTRGKGKSSIAKIDKFIL
jgi:hypothetical protein